MSEQHVTRWLPAYHDNELPAWRRHTVAAHLARCAGCRAELADMVMLSRWLHADDVAVRGLSTEQFVNQVNLQLPRRPVEVRWVRGLRTAWQWSPLALFGAWVFAQTLFAIVSGVNLAAFLGVSPVALTTVLPASPTPAWYTALLNISNWYEGGQWMWGNVYGVGMVVQGLTLNWVVLGTVGVLFSSWLASWWVVAREEV